MLLRFWCKNNRKCAIWIYANGLSCVAFYVGTLSNAKVDKHYAELNDRFCRPYGMICFTMLLIRHLYRLYATNFDRGLLQVVGNDTINTLFSLNIE